MMKANSRTAAWQEDLHIIWAITSKDMITAVRNKTTLGLLISTLFILLVYQVLPAFENPGALPVLLVYDAGDSDLPTALNQSPNLTIYTGYKSQAQLERKLVAGYTSELALTIPPGFDQGLDRGEPLPIEGYVQHWVSDSDAAELSAQAEAEIARLVGEPVEIHLKGNLVYPTPDSGGRSLLTSLGIMVSITLIGVGLAPHLMVEEKRTKTLDALLVSPARSSHLVIAKALTGLAYCLIAAVAVLAINASLVLHWGLAVAAVVLSSFFAVAIGLLLGSLVGAKPVLQIWSTVILTPLLLPLFLSIVEDLLPPAASTILAWFPTVTLSRVFRGSFSRDLATMGFSLELLVVAVCAAVVMAGVAWTVRRADR